MSNPSGWPKGKPWTAKRRAAADHYRNRISAAQKRAWARPGHRERVALAIRRSVGTYSANYAAIHDRARKALRGLPCALQDETCLGKLEATLRRDAPAEFVVTATNGYLVFVGLNPEDGYRILCHSHHIRERSAR